MENGNYDIDEVKRYFLYFTYPDVFLYKETEYMIPKLINSNSIFYQNITVLFFVEFFLVSLTLAFGFFIHAPLFLNFILCATI